MTSLKEVKTRIASVGNMKKITQARQMVSSAQLHRVQMALEKTTVYKEALDRLITGLLINNDRGESPFIQKQSSGSIAIVIMSSNTGMCGAFNANMIKVLQNIHIGYPGEKFLFFPIGKKIREAVERAGYDTGYEADQHADHLAGKITYEESAEMAVHLMELYSTQKVKHVELVYYHFKNMGKQEIKGVTLLPYSIPSAHHIQKVEVERDFIFEPSGKEVLKNILLMTIKSNFYYALMQNQTSEHGARTMAMQLATENADQVLSELRLTYNKLRQQNITSELLDIIGSSFV